MKFKIILIVTILLTACVFDSGGSEIVDDYTISWIDTKCTMTIVRGPIGQMEGQIYSIGWNADFIIAKRHPKCDQSITDYFIIDIEKNAVGSEDARLGVFGPFNEVDFKLKRKEFRLSNSMDFTLEP
mgnify:CR=1 FL=1